MGANLADEPNLFSRLHKGAFRQDENFLTEALAVVLEQLLILAPGVGTRLIKGLTGGFIDLPPGDAGSIEIRTQVETGQGRPDLEIASPHLLVWIEVKAESVLRAGQLEGYRLLLGQSAIEETRLVLLTRHPEVYASGAERPDLELRWFEVADWLESELLGLETAGEVAFYLARQFLDFLRIRGMTLTQVGKYMPEGLRALGNLFNMLFEAAASCNISAKITASREETGINLDVGKYRVGINYAEPEKLWFRTRCRIDHEAAVRLGVGEVTEESLVPGRSCWWQAAELDSEDVHFYSRTKVSQMQWLESFLRECLAMGRKIETPDQRPIPDDGEEA
jgi:hypothetical protein